MLPTDITAYLNGKNDAEARTAHQQHHERLHAPAVIVTPSKDAAANVAALNAAIVAATFSQHSRGYGGEVAIAPGVYPLDETVEIRGAFGLRLRGAGTASAFTWKGPAEQPMFRIVKSRECVFSDFRIRMETTGYAAIQLLRDNGTGYSPTHNCFRNLLIECENTTKFAVVIGGDGFVDANNDFNLFEHCTLGAYTEIGFNMSGSQSYNNQFNNCSLWGGDGAQYGYRTGKVGASVSIMGGGVNAHAAADIYIGRSTQPYIIRFVNSENSARFIEAPAEAYRQIVVEGCRWSGGALHADGRAIITSGLINMALNYCSIGNGGDPEKLLYLDFASTKADYGGGVIMTGCRVFSAAPDVFSADIPVRVDISTKITNEKTNTGTALTTAG